MRKIFIISALIILVLLSGCLDDKKLLLIENDADANKLIVLGKDSNETLNEILEDTIMNGVLDRITLTPTGGLDLDWSSGEVYIDGNIIDTVAGNETLTDNSTLYLYATNVSVETLIISATEPTGEHALVAVINTYDSNIEYTLEDPIISDQVETTHDALDKIIPEIVTNGMFVSEDTDVTLANDFTISAGDYFLHAHDPKSTPLLYSSLVSHDTNNTHIYYHIGGAWATDVNSKGVTFGQWDDGTDIAATSISKWYVGWIFVQGNGVIEYVFPQNEHNTESVALAEELTYPPFHQGFVVKLAKFVFRGSETAFDPSKAYFIDIRPMLGGGGAGGGVSQFLWATITSDAGSTTADDTLDVLTIDSTGAASTSVAGDTLSVFAPNSCDGNASCNLTTDFNATVRGNLVVDKNVGIGTNPTKDTNAVLQINSSAGALVLIGDEDDVNIAGAGAIKIGRSDGPLTYKTAWGENAISIGYNCSALGDESICIGSGADAWSSECMAIGFGTWCTGNKAFAIGNSNQAHGQDSVALGISSVVNGSNSSSLGWFSINDSDYSLTLLGSHLGAAAEGAISMGWDATPTGTYGFTYCSGSTDYGTGTRGITCDDVAPSESGLATFMDVNFCVNCDSAIGTMDVNGSFYAKDANFNTVNTTSISGLCNNDANVIMAANSVCLDTETFSGAEITDTNCSGNADCELTTDGNMTVRGDANLEQGLDVGGHGAYGNSATVLEKTILYIYEKFVGPTVEDIQGVYNLLIHDTAYPSPYVAYSMRFENRFSHTDGNGHRGFGVFGDTLNYKQGNMDAMVPGRFYTQNISSGHVVGTDALQGGIVNLHADGIIFNATNFGTATAIVNGLLINWDAFRVRFPTGNGTITNAVGLKIEQLDQAGTLTFTNDPYGILQEGSEKNRFNGAIGLGSDPLTKFTVDGTITLLEQADANADNAGYGQLWTKTATPNQLWFTTDAGDDLRVDTKSYVVLYQDLVGLDATGILTSRTWQDETVTVFALQPDVPRQTTINAINLDLFNIMTGTATINGIDADGATISEVLNISVSGGGPPITYTTDLAFAVLSSIVTDKTGASANSIYEAGWNDVVGLPNYPFSASGDVFKVKKDQADITVPTVNATYGTVDLSPILAREDFTFFYRPFK